MLTHLARSPTAVGAGMEKDVQPYDMHIAAILGRLVCFYTPETTGLPMEAKEREHRAAAGGWAPKRQLQESSESVGSKAVLDTEQSGKDVVSLDVVLNRAASLGPCNQVEASLALALRYLDSPSPVVRSMALVALCARDSSASEDTLAHLLMLKVNHLATLGPALTWICAAGQGQHPDHCGPPGLGRRRCDRQRVHGTQQADAAHRGPQVPDQRGMELFCAVSAAQAS